MDFLTQQLVAGPRALQGFLQRHKQLHRAGVVTPSQALATAMLGWDEILIDSDWRRAKYVRILLRNISNKILYTI